MTTPTPSGFVDLLDLDEPIILKKENEPTNENMTVINIGGEIAPKENEENKSNPNPFSFDFNSLSKKETQKKEVDQIDILFG